MFSLILFYLHPINVVKPQARKVVPQKPSKEKVIHKNIFLEKAIKGFMEHNQSIISIYHELSAVMYEYNQARGKNLPKVDLVGGLSNEQKSGQRRQFQDSYENRSQTSFNYGVEAVYNLFDGFSTINAVRSKDFEVQAHLYKGLDDVAKKLFEFIKLILTIQESELNAAIAERDVQRKEKMYKEAKNRVEAGAAGKQDEFQARAALDEATGMKRDAEVDFKNTKLQFFEWTGITYEKMPWLSIPENLLTKFDQLESVLPKVNLSVLKAQAALQSKEKKQKSTNGKVFSPHFELTFSAKNNIVKGFTEDTQTHMTHSDPKNTEMDFSTGLRCKIPLWSGGSDVSEARQAGKEVLAARHAFYSATQEAKIAFQNAKEAFVSAQDDHALYEEIVDNYQKSYEIAFDKYQSGASSFTDLADIANRLHRAEQILVKKEKERRQKAWELAQILGKLNPSSLCSSLDSNFDPFSVYNKVKSSI